MQAMARFGLFALLGAAVLLAGPQPPARPQTPGSSDAAIDSSLRVQKALARGDAYLLQGDPKAAVEVLEAELPRINGNRKYLARLRDAYRAYVAKLYADRQPALAQKYLERLCILDGSAAGDPARRPPAAAPTLAEMARNSGTPAAPAPTPPRTAPTVRAKIDDPFDQANAASPPGPADGKRKLGQAFLAQAEAAFGNHDFGGARRYFEQAHEADPACTAGSGDRWAYCKLSHVVEQLNRTDADPAAWADLERELLAAIDMAPRLADTGRWLRGEVQSRQRAADAGVAVRHLGKGAQGWEVAETTNFRVFHKQQRDLAEKAARAAERTRTAMYRKWFGSAGEAWNPRCDVYLHASAQDYSQATGQSAALQGHSRIESDRDTGRVVARRIDLHLDHPRLLDAVLPHETTHVVLAGQFGSHQVPRWADEGMAVLTEPADKVDQHRRNLARCHGEGQLLSVRDLMQLSDFPAPRQISAFYAQSVSLVDYLSRQRGAVVFTQFLRDGLREGYEAALRRHYGYRDLADLQQRWGQQALAGLTAGPTAVAER
jgi:tetratricopeptide (TPR) repeat protein